jgi:hypothetical protein
MLSLRLGEEEPPNRRAADGQAACDSMYSVVGFFYFLQIR